MKLHPSIMSKRLAENTAKRKKLQDRICHLEIQNHDLREKVAKLELKLRQLRQLQTNPTP